MKALQLTGVETYVSPATENTIIRKGETVIVAPKFWKHLAEQIHVNMTNVEVPYFTEVEVESATHDFVNKAVIDVVDPALLARLNDAKGAADQTDPMDGGTSSGDVGSDDTTKTAAATQRVARASAKK